MLTIALCSGIVDDAPDAHTSRRQAAVLRARRRSGLAAFGCACFSAFCIASNAASSISGPTSVSWSSGSPMRIAYT